MRTYCLSCRKDTCNFDTKKIKMANKVAKKASRDDSVLPISQVFQSKNLLALKSYLNCYSLEHKNNQIIIKHAFILFEM